MGEHLPPGLGTGPFPQGHQQRPDTTVLCGHGLNWWHWGPALPCSNGQNLSFYSPKELVARGARHFPLLLQPIVATSPPQG